MDFLKVGAQRYGPDLKILLDEWEEVAGPWRRQYLSQIEGEVP